MKHNAFRNGYVHVMAERCETCIFRNVNDGRIHLRPGRVAEMVSTARKNDSAIICHDTLGGDNNAVCRGFFDLPYLPTPLQLALRLDCIAYQEP